MRELLQSARKLWEGMLSCSARDLSDRPLPQWQPKHCVDYLMSDMFEQSMQTFHVVQSEKDRPAGLN